MKSSRIACAIAAAALTLGSFSAFAQGSGPDRNVPEARNYRYAERHQDRNGARGDDRRDFGRRDFDRRDDRRGAGRRDFNRPDYGQQRHYYGARGPEWRRGGHIPREYYNRQYYVSDWRGHHLAQPPYGHQWVQVGGDYVLIALATGIIANLILNQ